MFNHEPDRKKITYVVSLTLFNATTTSAMTKTHKTACLFSSKGPDPYYSLKLPHVTHLSLREGKP